MDLRPGDIVYGGDESEKYEIAEFIQSGGFGFVYKIRKSGTNEFFALKTIPTGSLDEQNLRALVNEGTLAPSIRHENVVSVFYFHDGAKYLHLPPYIIMEYLPDGTLLKLLESQRNSGKYFDNDQLATMFLQLSEGMRAVNSKLIHRDVKPDNILLANGIPKISDFGLSKVVGAATRTHSFKGIQHIYYKAPEAWQLEKNTIQMDIYSMGIVFYELATLSHPYKVAPTGDIFESWRDAHFFQKADPPTARNPSLNINLSQLIMKMMAKRPEDRYASWDEVIQRIQTAQTKEMPKIDVSKLIMKAIQTKEAEDKKRLELEKKYKEKQELEKNVHYKCEELVDGLKEIVEAFNKGFEGGKFQIAETTAWTPAVKTFSATFTKGGHINLIVEPVYQTIDFEGGKILAWGYFANSNAKGFNVVLLKSNPDDIYGYWLCLHNTHNVIARQKDRRPDPFPFDSLEEFSKEIKFVHAVHIYVTAISHFDKNMIMPLLEDIL